MSFKERLLHLEKENSVLDTAKLEKIKSRLISSAREHLLILDQDDYDSSIIRWLVGEEFTVKEEFYGTTEEYVKKLLITW